MTEPPPTAEKPPKLRWFQYRLRSLFVLTTLVAIACSFAVTIRNLRREGNCNMRFHWDCEGMARRAMSQFDTDGSRAIEGAELDKCPGLRAAMNRLDRNGTGKITAEMIAARIAEWDRSRLGRISLECRVTYNGKPLEGALVKFVPEIFPRPYYDDLDRARWTASGKTGKDGRAMLSVPVSGDRYDPPGVPPGFYRVEITSPREKVPAKYNTQTILGQEIAIDTVGPEVPITFDLEY
jgi:hypothetical protein